MRCMLLARWDLMSRSPIFRYGKVQMTGLIEKRVVQREKTSQRF
jgi:hypothetical protein